MTLLDMSISGAVIIMVIVLIRALAINRLPKKTFLFLWGIALCRLLVPFDFPSPFSAYNLIWQEAEVSQMQIENAIIFMPPMGQLPTGISTTGFLANSINIPLLVWSLETFALATYFIVAYFLCRQEFQMALPVQNDYVTNWLTQQTMKRTITIRQSSRISTPLTYGVWKPIILMPKNTNWQDTKQIEYVLAHELVHIKRFDTVTKLLLTSALCIHWFNPLVWAMYILSNRDMELSCDETVIRSFGDTTKSAYARTLISMEESKSKLTPLCNNFSKNAIEERITAIMKMKRTSIAALAAAILLVGGVTTVFATSASGNSDNSNISTEIGTAISRKVSNDSPSLYSLDDGATWISEDEYNTMYPKDDIVWWTYDEYKAWIDEQKVELPKQIGTDNKYLKDGTWVSFTQQSVDESIRQYENLLEEIKNGAKISKTVNGDDSIAIISTPPKEGDIGISYGGSIVAENGSVVDLGTFSSKEEQLMAVKRYCAEQVSTGKMSQTEADQLIKKYE